VIAFNRAFKSVSVLALVSSFSDTSSDLTGTSSSPTPAPSEDELAAALTTPEKQYSEDPSLHTISVHSFGPCCRCAFALIVFEGGPRE
jgi:hypothetical protein